MCFFFKKPKKSLSIDPINEIKTGKMTFETTNFEKLKNTLMSVSLNINQENRHITFEVTMKNIDIYDKFPREPIGASIIRYSQHDFSIHISVDNINKLKAVIEKVIDLIYLRTDAGETDLGATAITDAYEVQSAIFEHFNIKPSVSPATISQR